MFSNAKQSIPDRFQEKKEIDKMIGAIRCQIEDVISSYGNVISFDDIALMRAELEPLRMERDALLEKQTALRRSCEAFITERRARGPETTA